MITWNRIFFQSPSSFMIELVILIHDYVTITLLSVIVLVMLVIGSVFYSRRFNLNFYDDHQLERIWTFTPFVLLIFILVPSLSSLFMLDTCLFCGISVIIVGHQWYWRYSYRDFKSLIFDSYIVPSSDSKLRLVDVDNRLLIPRSFPVRFIVSSADVIHSWTLPSFGLKIDAVPGRINQFCLSSKRSGVFFGQCSEICGANHRFIPIVIEAVPFSKFLRCVLLSNLYKVFIF